jgi:hypothetical protein
VASVHHHQPRKLPCLLGDRSPLTRLVMPLTARAGVSPSPCCLTSQIRLIPQSSAWDGSAAPRPPDRQAPHWVTGPSRPATGRLGVIGWRRRPLRGRSRRPPGCGRWTSTGIRGEPQRQRPGRPGQEKASTMTEPLSFPHCDTSPTGWAS